MAMARKMVRWKAVIGLEGYVLDAAIAMTAIQTVHRGNQKSDGIDNDCDDLVDDDDDEVTGDATWYADTDGDGFGDASGDKQDRVTSQKALCWTPPIAMTRTVRCTRKPPRCAMGWMMTAMAAPMKG